MAAVQLTRKDEKTIKDMTEVRLHTVNVGGRRKKNEVVMHKNFVVCYTKHILKKKKQTQIIKSSL